MLYKDLLIDKVSFPGNFNDQSAVSGFKDEYFQYETSTEKYLNLKTVHELQAGTVRHCLHNVMTPVSAMSGYLDLLNDRLNRGSGDEKLERYSQKIAEGLQEVGFLLEQLHSMYKTQDRTGQAGDYPEINLNWLAEEVTDIINGSFELTAEKVVFNPDPKPVFIEADLFQIKLIIYNMIISADQFTTGNSRIVVETGFTDTKTGMAGTANQSDKTTAPQTGALLTIRCSGETIPNPRFTGAFENGKLTSRTDGYRQASAHSSPDRNKADRFGADMYGAGAHGRVSPDAPSSAVNGLLISCRMAGQIGGNISLITDEMPNKPLNETSNKTSVRTLDETSNEISSEASVKTPYKTSEEPPVEIEDESSGDASPVFVCILPLSTLPV